MPVAARPPVLLDAANSLADKPQVAPDDHLAERLNSDKTPSIPLTLHPFVRRLGVAMEVLGCGLGPFIDKIFPHDMQ